MTGTRKPGRPIFYPRAEVAIRHGAAAEKETPNPREAYAGYAEERAERPASRSELPWS